MFKVIKIYNYSSKYLKLENKNNNIYNTNINISINDKDNNNNIIDMNSESKKSKLSFTNSISPRKIYLNSPNINEKSFLEE